jgi:hypothetical protein
VQDSRVVRTGGVVAAEVYEPEGSARLELVSGVALLHEEDALVEAMLTGWAKQQLGGRGLAEKTVQRRQAIVRRFLEFSNEYPWHWTAAHLDEWSADLVCVLGRAKSTIRGYHDAIAPSRATSTHRSTAGPRSAMPVSEPIRCGSVSSRTPPRIWWTTKARQSGGR